VSNVDPADLVAKLDGLDPAKTLFIVASKTFSTLETLTNATAARRWLTDVLGDAAVSKHFVAVSTNSKLVDEFGIDTDNMFGFGLGRRRYSVDSAIGLAVMAAIGGTGSPNSSQGSMRWTSTSGPHRWRRMRLCCLAYRRFGTTSSSVPRRVRYCRTPMTWRVSRHICKQLTMESNGKSVRGQRTPVSTKTGEIFWGEPGTMASTRSTNCCTRARGSFPPISSGLRSDRRPTTADGTGSMQDLLMSNLFAQTQVLAFGKSAEEIAAEGTPADVVPHKVMPGNRPSTTILATKLTPSTVAQLIPCTNTSSSLRA